MISVVTITYNDLPGLEKTADSIYKQENKNFEWIVIDGGSTDGTKNYLMANNRVDRFISEKDDGIYHAMQKGLIASGGDYIIFLNSGDCFCDSNGIEFIARDISSDPVDVIFYGTLLLASEKIFVRKARKLQAAIYSVPAVQQSTVYSRGVLLGLIWPRNYKICGDYFIAAQLLKRGSSYLTSDYILSEFSLGGVSTNKYMLLAREAREIQATILGLSSLSQCFYYLRRIFVGCIASNIYNIQGVLNGSRSK